MRSNRPLIGSVTCASLCASGLAFQTTARGATPYTPVGIVGTGTYTNSATLIIDGVLPPRTTNYTDPTDVNWSAAGVTFTIDLGTPRSVASLVADLDNNDDYLVQSSVDGATFSPLFTFLASDGPVTPVPGGLDILTTDPTYPTLPTNSTTPAYVGRSFAPVTARYLRLSASGGDNLYGLAEVQAFAAVPEPVTAGVLAIAAAAGLVGRRRRTRPSARIV